MRGFNYVLRKVSVERQTLGANISSFSERCLRRFQEILFGLGKYYNIIIQTLNKEFANRFQKCENIFPQLYEFTKIYLNSSVMFK